MQDQFRNKIIVVTGGTQGLGAATARPGFWGAYDGVPQPETALQDMKS